MRGIFVSLVGCAAMLVGLVGCAKGTVPGGGGGGADASIAFPDAGQQGTPDAGQQGTPDATPTMMTATLSQTTSSTVTAANSASCSANNLHADNRYIRIFDLPAMGINSAFTVTQVSFGIETALGNAGTQPATVLLHTVTGGNSISNLVQLAATSVTISDQEGTLMNVAINATVPAGSKLAVELFTPNGQTTNNSFFIGSNSLGETTPGFVVAADCMLNDMTTPGAFGFPGMHMILEASGTYLQ